MKNSLLSTYLGTWKNAHNGTTGKWLNSGNECTHIRGARKIAIKCRVQRLKTYECRKLLGVMLITVEEHLIKLFIFRYYKLSICCTLSMWQTPPLTTYFSELYRVDTGYLLAVAGYQPAWSGWYKNQKYGKSMCFIIFVKWPISTIVAKTRINFWRFSQVSIIQNTAAFVCFFSHRLLLRFAQDIHCQRWVHWCWWYNC